MATGNNGAMSIIFAETCDYVLPPTRSQRPSVFAFSLPKAGSTLLDRLILDLAKTQNMTYVGIMGHYFNKGVLPQNIPQSVSKIFFDRGYAYSSFRYYPYQFEIPCIRDCKKVLLLRDPRDMLTSLYYSVAYSHPLPKTGESSDIGAKLIRQRQIVQQTNIDDYVLDHAAEIKKLYESYRKLLNDQNLRLYRYEDVVLNKVNWVNDIAEFFDWSISLDAVGRVVAKHDKIPKRDEPQSHVRQVMPGDHLRKLKPETIAALDQVFSEELVAYGYLPPGRVFEVLSSEFIKPESGASNFATQATNAQKFAVLPPPLGQRMVPPNPRFKDALKTFLSFLWRKVRKIVLGSSPRPLPRISILTPVKNGGAYIEMALVSVLNQEYPNLEYIIVDGGSTDGTLDVIRRYQLRDDLPQRIHHVISESDLGMYDALAKGFRIATGDVFGYLNSDDMYENGAMNVVGRAFAASPSMHVAYFDDTVDVDGWRFPNLHQPTGVNDADLFNGHVLFQDGVFFSRVAYQSVGGFRSKFKLAGDYDLWLRLSRRYEFVRHPEHVSCFRMRQNQLSADRAGYESEKKESRRDFVKSLSRVEWFSLQLRRLMRISTSVRRFFYSSRLFFPFHFPIAPGVLPSRHLCGNVSPKVAIPTPVSPIDKEPAQRLLFSTYDTRFGEPRLSLFYLDTRNQVAICAPEVSESELDRLYETNYSSRKNDLINPNSRSPYRDYGNETPMRRLERLIPSNFVTQFATHLVARLVGHTWADQTLRELTKVLCLAGVNVHRPLRVLDVGCFEGNLLDQIRGTKPWIGAGIESNREACKVAAGKGLEVWCCHAEGAVDVIPKDRHFDVVFMAQTIEHLDDPLKALIRLRQLLAPKGLIVISTPNLDSVEIDWYGPTWAHWHAPYHRFVFSRRGLTALAREAGLMPCCYRSFSHAYWSAMSLSLNKLGVAGAVPHTCRFDFAVRQSATRIDMIKSLLHNRLGRGDYSFMAMKELVDA